MHKVHSIICYLNASVFSFYFIVSIFYLELPSEGLPYFVQVPGLLVLCLLPAYVVRNAEAVLAVGHDDFSRDKYSAEVQKKILLWVAYGFTLVMSIYSLLILKATFDGFDYRSPLL